MIFWLEVLLVLFLIIINAFFASSEIAIVSSRKSRIRHLMEQGDKRARLVHDMQNEPEKFLATVQIGITVIGILAGAISGAIAMEMLQPLIAKVPVPIVRKISTPLSIGIVSLITSYLSLVLGELVPKTLALRFSDTVALLVARPMTWITRISSIPVKILTKSAGLFVKPFGEKIPSQGSFVTAEEIKIMLREGSEKGIFKQSEKELIHGVFKFADTTVKDIMVPRPNIKAIEIHTPIDKVIEFVSECGYSRFPVYDRILDDIKGILYEKDLLEIKFAEKDVKLETLLRPAYFVPETKKIDTLLRELQRRRIRMAIVINEYGNVEGLVTLEDIIEEIVGEIEDEYDFEDRPVKVLRDGSMIIEASLPIRDLITQHHLEFEESEEYETLAGLIMSLLQRMPRAGDIVRYKHYKLTIVDMEGRRIAKVKLEKTKEIENQPKRVKAPQSSG